MSDKSYRRSSIFRRALPLLLVGLLWTGSSAPSCKAQDGASAKTQLADATAHLRAGNLPQALQILEPFRQETPPNPEALSLLGALYLELGRPEDALITLEKHVGPETDPRTLFHAARAALALGRLEQGERYLVDAVAKAPTSFAAIRLAELRSTQERPADVVSVLAPMAEGPVSEQILQQDPALAARIAWLFANALVDTDQSVRAVPPLERLSRLEPEDHTVWKLYGQALIDADRIDEAQAALTRAQELDAVDHQASIDARERETAKAPANPEAQAQLQRAVEAYNGGRRDEALSALQKAIALDPSDSRPRALEIQLLIDLERAEEVLPKVDALLTLAPDDPEAYFLRGMAKLELADLKGAEADLRTALERQPEHRGGMNALALTLIRTDRATEALPLLERVLELWPNDRVARRNLERIRAAP